MADIVRRAKYEIDTGAVTKATADLNNMAKASEGVSLASLKQEKAHLSLTPKLERLQRQLDAQYRAEQQYLQHQRLLDAAVAQGTISIGRKNELLALSAARTSTAVTANENFAKSTNASKAALTNLSFQINDIARRRTGPTRPAEG